MVVPPPPACRAMSAKPALRARLRALRDAFVADGPAPVLPQPLFLDALAPGRIVASYVPLGSEADPQAFDDAARAGGAILALPVVIDRASPILFRNAATHGLTAGPFGLRQPPHEAPALAPDIILTPLVGFDSRCNRLGQGAGHYDRAFAAWPDALRIGIAWSVQRVAALPADPWDVPLHAVVTERGIHLPGESD